MMTVGVLILVAPKKNNLVGMVSGFNKKIEVCRYQPTKGRTPKMILTKFANTASESYKTLPHNYGYSFHMMSLAPVFHAKIRGLTRSGRCFTLEELEDHRNAKGRDDHFRFSLFFFYQKN